MQVSERVVQVVSRKGVMYIRWGEYRWFESQFDYDQLCMDELSCTLEEEYQEIFKETFK